MIAPVACTGGPVPFACVLGPHLAVTLSLWGLVCPVAAGVRMIQTHPDLAQSELLTHPTTLYLGLFSYSCPTAESRNA